MLVKNSMGCRAQSFRTTRRSTRHSTRHYTSSMRGRKSVTSSACATKNGYSTSSQGLQRASATSLVLQPSFSRCHASHDHMVAPDRTTSPRLRSMSSRLARRWGKSWASSSISASGHSRCAFLQEQALDTDEGGCPWADGDCPVGPRF